MTENNQETISGVFGHTINISDCINDDKEMFEDFAKKKQLSKEVKEKYWQCYVEWQSQWLRLIGNTIPSPFTECAVETKQEYKDFKFEDIINVLQNLGEQANSLYTANRDVFELDIASDDDLPEFSKQYVYRLERLAWMIATFVQEGNFTDLVSQLKEAR